MRMRSCYLEECDPSSCGRGKFDQLFAPLLQVVHFTALYIFLHFTLLRQTATFQLKYFNMYKLNMLRQQERRQSNFLLVYEQILVEGEAGGDAEARVDCHGGGWTVEEPNIWTQGLSQAPVHEGEAEDAHRNKVNNAVRSCARGRDSNCAETFKMMK